MKTIRSLVSFVALVTLILGSPATTRTAGGAEHGDRSGTTVGSPLGALARAILGGYIDRKECDAIQTARGYKYKPKEGALIKVEEVKVEPELVEPGNPSLLMMTYAVLNPDPNTTLQVSERRQIISGREMLKEIGPMVMGRAPGTYYSQQEVTFPTGLTPGQYAFKGVVEAGGKTSHMETQFRIARVPSDSGYAYLIQKIDTP